MQNLRSEFKSTFTELFIIYKFKQIYFKKKSYGIFHYECNFLMYTIVHKIQIGEIF